VQISADKTWVSVSAGGSYSLALKADGTLWAWGDNSDGQFGDGTNIDSNVPVQIGTESDWSFIEAGDSHTATLKADWTLWTSGWNYYGQLGDGTTTSRNVFNEVHITYFPSANAGGPYGATEGQGIVLDASNSSDTDGYITLYEWDVDDDGVYEYSSSSESQTHVYIQHGTYTIRLRVTDNDGAIDEATTTADIVDTSPVADFTGSPLSGVPPLIVNYVNNSTGYDQPLSYEWDFDNDGITDSTEQSPSYTYNTAGIYTVTLKVTDADGSTNSLTRTDYVAACFSPVRIAGASPEYYSTLQEAYNAAQDGNTIQSRDMTFSEDLLLNRNITITIIGGYDCGYDINSGSSRISGSMTINNGAVNIENFILQ
jgi:PKD repeat protein